MSSGPFQNLPGSGEMGGSGAFPTEPWLLPISDHVADTGVPTDAQWRSVHRPSRFSRVAMHALIATLLLMMAGGIGAGWMGAGSPKRSTHQVADAKPPIIPTSKASLTVSN